MQETSRHKFPYRWRLKDGYPAKGIEYHGKKVFGTFICGGGSTMGYKLAGYEHLGGVEIDPKIAAIYKENHHPKMLYTMDIREFNKLKDLPSDLFDLDLLDGSPPCSTFSTSGSREKAWGKEKVFAEGQAKQTLDDLTFEYCQTIDRLKPKVCLLENVSGLVKGNAKVYAKRIKETIEKSGYRVQLFLLNAATMGVPQARQRVFFIGLRNDFKLPPLKLEFNEKPILFGELIDRTDTAVNLSEYRQKLWPMRKPTDKSFADILARTENGRLSMFDDVFIKSNEVAPTLKTKGGETLYELPRLLNNKESCLIDSFPIDYEGGAKDKMACWYERPTNNDGASIASNLSAMAVENKRLTNGYTN